MPTADSYARMLTPKRPAPLSPFKKPSVSTYTNRTRPAISNSTPVGSSGGSTGGNTGGGYRSSTDGYYYGGGGGGGGGTYGIAPLSAAPAVSKDDWIAADPGYKAQRDALAKALADYTANYNAEIGQYDVDYEKGLRSLGWDFEKLDDPMTKENEGVGTWNLTDMTRSSGRSYQNQLNDFASRNMLQSSLYAQAVSDLMRSLDEQLGNVNTARQNFRNDKQRALTAYKTDNESQRNLAYADAASRYAALFGV